MTSISCATFFWDLPKSVGTSSSHQPYPSTHTKLPKAEVSQPLAPTFKHQQRTPSQYKSCQILFGSLLWDSALVGKAKAEAQPSRCFMTCFISSGKRWVYRLWHLHEPTWTTLEGSLLIQPEMVFPLLSNPPCGPLSQSQWNTTSSWLTNSFWTLESPVCACLGSRAEIKLELKPWQ